MNDTVDGEPVVDGNSGANRTPAPTTGSGLCLSGGGYRAMVFHLGALLRLYETGILRSLDRISSVSGGSITAGVLALAWNQLPENPDRKVFFTTVIDPVLHMADQSIDVQSGLAGIVLPGRVSDFVRRAYDENLFKGRTLQDLPDTPRFVFNATNLQSGVLWRFSKPYCWDYRVGKIENPEISVAAAVAASSAFPPFLSPYVLDVDPDMFVPESGKDLQVEPYTDQVYLCDGGVYDNLGLETVWKSHATVFVSDAGGQMAPDPAPDTDWVRQPVRILNVIDNQVRALRKLQLIRAFENSKRAGAYWGIRTDIGDYGLPTSGNEAPLLAPFDQTTLLAEIPTRLTRLTRDRKQKLVNWGYAVSDAAIRRHFNALIPPGEWPFPATGV